MGVAIAVLGQVAGFADHREASHGHRVASGRISQILDLAQPAQRWPSQDRSRGSRTDQAHGHRQHVGRPSHPRRVAEAGHPRLPGHGVEVHASTEEATIADMADVARHIPHVACLAGSTEHGAHVKNLVSVDFFTVPTVFLHVLFVFVVLAHDRRRILSINVTSSPSASWAANQVVQAFPWETVPRYLLRDRDGIYRGCFRGRVQNLRIKEVLIAPRSPWQSPFVERVIGTLRRELLDHVIVMNEQHLRRLLRTFVAEYYHRSRTHLSLGKDSPDPRSVEPSSIGNVVELPVVGGLHHLYTRRAA